MERKKVIGKQKVDYVSRKTGNPVKGISLHCVCSKGNVEGTAVETIFISEKAVDLHAQAVKLPLESEIDCTFNRWGSVDTFYPVDAK